MLRQIYRTVLALIRLLCARNNTTTRLTEEWMGGTLFFVCTRIRVCVCFLKDEDLIDAALG